MTQEDRRQPVVPFGKYKGKPVECLLQDESYAKWLVGQDWFQQKFQTMYTLVINNYHAEPVDTPEHNQMQVKFLNESHALKLAFLASGGKLFQFDNNHFTVNAPKFLEDLKQIGIDLPEILNGFNRLKGRKLLNFTKIEFEKKGLDVHYDVSYGYSDFGVSETTYRRAATVLNKFWNNSSCNQKIRVELKPYVGDDFPAVLRQMKTSGANILVIKEYTGTGASFEEFKRFFTSQDMKIFSEQEIEQVTIPVFNEFFEFEDNIFIL